MVDQGNNISDWNIGEVLLKYMLCEEVRPLCGMGVNQVQTEEVCESERLGG